VVMFFPDGLAGLLDKFGAGGALARGWAKVPGLAKPSPEPLPAPAEAENHAK
jgi:hypothetical protein